MGCSPPWSAFLPACARSSEAARGAAARPARSPGPRAYRGSRGVPDKAAIEALAEHLDALGDTHAGVHFATIGWILPQLHDPDGHEIRFYTTQHHTRPGTDPLRGEDPVESAARRERAGEVRE